MPGLLEIAIVAVVLLVFFGYKKLPALGRSAGEGVKQLQGSAHEVVGDKLDPSTLGKSAGKGVREMREFKQAVMGGGPDNRSTTEVAKSKPEAQEAAPAEKRAPAQEPAERVDGELVESGENSGPTAAERPA